MSSYQQAFGGEPTMQTYAEMRMSGHDVGTRLTSWPAPALAARPDDRTPRSHGTARGA